MNKCANLYTCINFCVNIFICIHVQLYIYIFMYTYTYTYICIYIRVYMYIYIYIYICIYIHTHTYVYIYLPLGQKCLEMAHELRGVCFKLWVKKSCCCFLHSPRSHVGDVLWNSEPDSRRQFSHCFWSAFLVFRKMRFRTESAKTYHPKHTQEGSSFWPYGIRLHVSFVCMYTFTWRSI